jgi:hypothetical protein
VSGLLICVGVGVGVGDGVGDGIGVGVGDGVGVGVGVGIRVDIGVGEVVGVGVGIGVGAGFTFLTSLQINFFPDLTHRNSLADLITTFPSDEHVAPAFTAPYAGKVEKTVALTRMTKSGLETRKN